MNVFVYGTLKNPSVQKAICGREFFATHARLHNWRLVESEEFHDTIEYDENSALSGLLLEDVSELELALLDQYETDSYKRSLVQVQSERGPEQAFVFRAVRPLKRVPG